MKVYVLLNDKEPGTTPKIFYEFQKEKFSRWNSEGWGVYFAVNEFEATDEQVKASGKSTVRQNNFVSKLRYAYGDLDIAKKGDRQTREAKEQKKKIIIAALIAYCEPTFIIGTSNGVQPLCHQQLQNTLMYIEHVFFPHYY